SPRRDGACPTNPILCVSIFFCFMMRLTHVKPLPTFASQSVMLCPERRIPPFHPPSSPVVQLSCLLTRDKVSKLKRRAPRKHVPSKVVLRKRQNEVLKQAKGDSSLIF